MALRRAFRATDRIQYALWPGPAAPPLVHYADYLISAPRLYQEELACFNSTYSPGILYVTPGANPYGSTVINFFSVLTTVAWPSWGTARWRFDGQAGHLLGVDHFTTAFSSGAIVFDQMTSEPNGSLWWFGQHADAYHSGPVQVDPVTFGPPGGTWGTSPYPASSFLDKNGGATIGYADFAIDRAGDRLFARWLTSNVGEVSIYRLSTLAYLTSIYTPNKTCGVVLTHDGFVYVADEADWLCVYDYNGVFQNAFRNPRRSDYGAAVASGFGSGVAYGWDRYYKRILFVGATPNAADGACKMRIWGYYPVPDAAGVTPPLPRQVPRAGRRVYVVSHCYGEGAEPLASRSATATGADVGSAVTDREGDAVVAVTASAAGTLPVEISVDVNVTPADAAETDAASVAGRTLLLTLEQPATVGQVSRPAYSVGTVPCQVTIGANGVTPYTALFVFDRSAVSLAHVELSVTGAGPTLSGSVAIPAAGLWNVCVLVTDAAANHGQASQFAGISVT